MEREEFIRFLREILIPDLLESGRVCTAGDFAMACEFMENEAAMFVRSYIDEDYGFDKDRFNSMKNHP